jgi:hypothetical protein
MRSRRCANDNHGRAVVTVRFCATCGETVNPRIPAARCAQETHAARRRTQSVHCVDCGDALRGPHVRGEARRP